MANVASEIHCGHSALAKLALEVVPAGERFAQVRRYAVTGLCFQIFACG